MTARDGQGRADGPPRPRVGALTSSNSIHYGSGFSTNLHETAPTAVMVGTAFEADERCTTTRGKKSTPPPDPTDPPRRRANKRKGHGTYANDRPPIISVISRETGEQRWWVGDPANTRTCATLIAENIPTGQHAALHRCVAELPGQSSVPCDGPPRRARSGRGMMMAMAGVRCTATPVRGRAQHFGPLCVPSVGSISGTCISMWRTYEALVNTKRVTPTLIRRMCVRDLSAHSSYT